MPFSDGSDRRKQRAATRPQLPGEHAAADAALVMMGCSGGPPHGVPKPVWTMGRGRGGFHRNSCHPRPVNDEESLVNPMRVGVIGTGFGSKVAAPAFEQTPGCQVVDVVSARDEAGVAGLCSRADLHLVSIHSPPFLHADHVRQAIDAGHAVLCEKPFGRSVKEATVMCELVGSPETIGLLNFEFRYDEARRQLRSLVQGGAVGQPEHVQISALLAGSRSPLRPYGWLFDKDLGGGWIGAWGSHIVDFLRWTLGEIEASSAQLRTAIPQRPDRDGLLRNCTAEDGFTATLTTSGGVTVVIDSTFAAPVTLPPAIVVVGSTGVLEQVGSRLVRHDLAGTTEEYEVIAPSLTGTMARWAAVVRDAVLSGSPDPEAATFADGLACRRVLDAFLSDPLNVAGTEARSA
jgi:predicted dehydrogenase